MARGVLAALVAAVMIAVAPGVAPTSFVNWETPHVHPLDLTPAT